MPPWRQRSDSATTNILCRNSPRHDEWRRIILGQNNSDFNVAIKTLFFRSTIGTRIIHALASLAHQSSFWIGYLGKYVRSFCWMQAFKKHVLYPRVIAKQQQWCDCYVTELATPKSKQIPSHTIWSFATCLTLVKHDWTHIFFICNQ